MLQLRLQTVFTTAAKGRLEVTGFVEGAVEFWAWHMIGLWCFSPVHCYPRAGHIGQVPTWCTTKCHPSSSACDPPPFDISTMVNPAVTNRVTGIFSCFAPAFSFFPFITLWSGFGGGKGRRWWGQMVIWAGSSSIALDMIEHPLCDDAIGMPGWCKIICLVWKVGKGKGVESPLDFNGKCIFSWCAHATKRPRYQHL